MLVVNIHYLNRAWATGMLVLAAVPVWADQYVSVLHADYQVTEWRFHASPSTNASFLTGMKCRNLSFLECSGQVRTGKLVDYGQSDRSQVFDIRTGAYYRFNERLMLTGSLSYGADRGKHMSGSAFLHPEDAPFDLVEMDPFNAGTKRREWYSLSGRAGYAVQENLSVGAALDYTVENYAKFKDLRHQNVLMDFKLSVGGHYKVSELFTLGAAYSYRRNLQRVSFKIYGNTDRQYASLISFGGFFGRSELFGESGYTSNPLPLFTQTHGGSLQLVIEKPAVKWFHELGFYQADGHFGTGASTSITYSHHRGNRLEYRSKLTVDRSHRFHAVELNAYSQSLDNYENSYKESTEANGVSQIIYYGSNQVGDKEWKGVDISYTFLSGSSQKKRADWSAGVGTGYDARCITASQYPFFRKQDIYAVHGRLFFIRNWLGRKNGYTLSGEAGYAAGWGNRNLDGTYTLVSGHQKVPVTQDDYLVQEYDYRVSHQMKYGISLGYERVVVSHWTMYVKVDAVYRVALNTSLKGEHQTVCGFSAGVKF